MAIGTSIFLLALGTILRFAVYYSVRGIAISVVGVILMIAARSASCCRSHCSGRGAGAGPWYRAVRPAR